MMQDMFEASAEMSLLTFLKASAECVFLRRRPPARPPGTHARSGTDACWKNARPWHVPEHVSMPMSRPFSRPRGAATATATAIVCGRYTGRGSRRSIGSLSDGADADAGGNPKSSGAVPHAEDASPPRVAPSSLVRAAPAPEMETLSFEFDKSTGKLGFKVKPNPKGKGFLIKSIDAGSLVEGKLAVDDLISRVNRRDASQLDDIKDIGKLLKMSSTVAIDVVRMF